MTVITDDRKHSQQCVFTVCVAACLLMGVWWIVDMWSVLFSFFAAWRWISTAWRTWTALGERGFQQAVSLIITHTHTLTHTIPSDPGRFLPLADLLADACPVTAEKERKRGGERKCVFVHVRLRPVPANRYPSRIRELCLTPGQPCSALAAGVRFFFFFFFFCWGLKTWEAHRVLAPR